MEKQGSAINWKLCFICQKRKKETTRSTIAGITSVGRIIEKLIDINYTDTSISRLSCTSQNTDIIATLSSNNACYHHSCSLNYNENMYNR